MNSYFSRIITARTVIRFLFVIIELLFLCYFQILQVVNITEEDIHYLITLFHVFIWNVKYRFYAIKCQKIKWVFVYMKWYLSTSLTNSSLCHNFYLESPEYPLLYYICMTSLECAWSRSCLPCYFNYVRNKEAKQAMQQSHKRRTNQVINISLTPPQSLKTHNPEAGIFFFQEGWRQIAARMIWFLINKMNIM